MNKCKINSVVKKNEECGKNSFLVSHIYCVPNFVIARYAYVFLHVTCSWICLLHVMFASNARYHAEPGAVARRFRSVFPFVDFVVKHSLKSMDSWCIK